MVDSDNEQIVAARKSPLMNRRKKRRRTFASRSRRKQVLTSFCRTDGPASVPVVPAPIPVVPPPVLPAPVSGTARRLSLTATADGSDDDWAPTPGSPSDNTRSKKRKKASEACSDDEVDEEIYLDRLEQYHKGTSKPKDQLYRKVDKRGRVLFTKDEHRQRRMAIHYLFTTVYGGPVESTGLWDGNKGIAVRIRESLVLKSTWSQLVTIKKTMRSISVCNAMNKPYYGERDQHKPYEKYYIKKTDFEAQLIADLIEAGLGFTETTEKVNEWRRANGRVLPNGQSDVGRSCVYLTSKRLKPKVTVIKKRPQGSLNKESDWCKASHRWACQMLIMLGELKKDSQIPKKLYYDEKFGAMTELPKCFTISLVRKVDIKCCTYFDESHKKARAGKVQGNTKVQHQFPRDEDGALDFSENGKYAIRGTELHMKYTKEARFMYAMCLKLDDSGNILCDTGPNGEKRPLGKVLEEFECTEQKITSHPDHDKLFWKVCYAPKNFAKKKPWYQDNRVEGAIYEGDPVTELRHIGDKAKESLAALDPPITTVKEYYDYFMNPANLRTGMNRRKNFGKRVQGMSYEKVTTAMNAAEAAIEGNPPKPTDCRGEKNPYFARFGKKWKQEVLNTATMRKFVNIRDLVRHIFRICQEEYSNTMYKDLWTFYHDAPSLMVSKDCLDWMKTQGYLRHWVLPQHQLNSMFPYYKSNPKPVGNHAPAMPWDMSSNYDHDLIALRHVAATFHLDEDDPRKFSLATPKKVSYAHRRTYNNPVVERDGKPLMEAGKCGIPAHRLGHDTLETVNYWWQVFENEGLNQQVNTSGHRGKETRNRGKWGGPRTKAADKTDEDSNWYHPDAKGEFERLFKNSVAKYNNKLKQLKKQHGEITQENDNTGMNPDFVEVEEINNNNNKDDEEPKINNLLQEEEEEEDGEDTDYEDDDVLLALEKEDDGDDEEPQE